jgi:hypothetical protein
MSNEVESIGLKTNMIELNEYPGAIIGHYTDVSEFFG